jgi:hypothetical protein
MALTKVTNTGIADDAVTTDKIEDGTVLAVDIAPGTVPATKLASTLNLSSKSVTLASGEISNAELANSSITVNGSSVSLGGSATVKHIDWQAVTVADGSTTLNTTAGKGYFLDTNAGVIEVFLPSSPTRGDTVVLADYSGTFATNQIIINTGGQLLDSTAGNDFKVTTNNSIVELVYVDAAKGWLVKLNQAAGTTPSGVMNDAGGYDTPIQLVAATGGTVTTSGDYKIHVFTGDGCFTVSCVSPCSPAKLDYIVVAGGGSGGAGRGGGGGAGGMRLSAEEYTCGSPIANPTGLSFSATTYPVTVGGGGAARVYPASPMLGNPGSNSAFSTITSAGGGAGQGENTAGSGASGGSGGGGAINFCTQTGGGSGNSPPVAPPQGNNGGSGAPGPACNKSGGGGGGAATAGSNGTGTPSTGGAAGIGSYVPSSFGTPTGTPGPISGAKYFAGGGGGSPSCGSPSPPIAGGFGGGGGSGVASGFSCSGFAATSGTANTGGGGGGGGHNACRSGAAGGKGIVVIRYKYQIA